MRFFFLLAVAGAVCLVSMHVCPARAQWIANGVNMAAVTGDQYEAKTVSDGSGGAIIVWTDDRNGSCDIYAQRLDAYGNALWAENGVPVCTNWASQYYFDVTADGEGGAFVSWYDGRSGTDDIYAQRIDSEGNILWAAEGVPICTASNRQYASKIITDGDGGAIIIWQDNRFGTDWDVYAQRVDGSGTTLWPAGGYLVCFDSADQQHPAIVEDGYGGAYVAWEDNRNDASDIYLQRINSNGTMRLGADGKPICTEANNQYGPRLASDGLGGVILVWVDNRTWDYDIYAQRIDDFENTIWTAGGLGVCISSDPKYDPVLVPDGQHGAIIAWEFYHAVSNFDIYVQRVSAMGTPLWAANGIPVCSANRSQTRPAIVSDGMGGAIISWEDERYAADTDVYAQRIDPVGIALWTAGGILACTAPNDQYLIQSSSDMLQGAILVFVDLRTGLADVTAQRIERNGYWGYPAPSISSVRDVQGDQGGVIRLSWDASRLDVYPEDAVSSYTIWRDIGGAMAMAAVEGGAILLEDVANPAKEIPLSLVSDPLGEMLPLDQRVVIRRESIGSSTYYWEYVMTVESSYYTDTYAVQVPTLFDSTASSEEYHYFQVIAHESDPTGFWISEPDSGYSVDNLAPCPPAGVTAEPSSEPEGFEIAWEPNTETDLACYAIYRSTNPLFEPSPENLLSRPCDPEYFDSEWLATSGFWYKLSAVDVHGNESGYVIISPGGVTGDETPAVPATTYLTQNFPNPFNPATMIEFGLSEAGRVSLRIYDTAGRLVRILVDEAREAGRYTEEWDGRDGAGRAVSSGVYFYRVEASTFAETRKMVLLR
jgi:hypothetical protein